jgi:hypothetical protein
MKDVRTLADAGELAQVLAGIRELFQRVDATNQKIAA